MDRHLIRLRKAWDCLDLDAPGEGVRRLDLPVAGSARESLPRRARLSRAFANPLRSGGREAAAIRFERTAGLRSIRLNDRAVPIPNPSPAGFEIAAPDLRPRNRLVLEVDFDAAASSRDDWGMIALAIQSAD